MLIYMNLIKADHYVLWYNMDLLLIFKRVVFRTFVACIVIHNLYFVTFIVKYYSIFVIHQEFFSPPETVCGKEGKWRWIIRRRGWITVLWLAQFAWCLIISFEIFSILRYYIYKLFATLPLSRTHLYICCCHL